MKYILSLLVATTFAVAQEVGVEVEEKVEVQKVIKHAGLTREEIALVRTEQEHYVVNDIITRQTVSLQWTRQWSFLLNHWIIIIAI